METFTATYFDGRTSLGHAATVRPGDGRLDIVLAGETGMPLVWHGHDLRAVHVKQDGTVVIRHGPFPHQVLEVADPRFGDALHAAFAGTPFLSRRSLFARLSVPGILVAGTIFVALAITVYFYLLPALADTFARRLPYDSERALGVRMNERLVAGNDVDTAATVHLQAFFDAMQLAYEHPVTVVVVQGRDANAFAIPGGFIYINDSLLRVLDRPEQLAALLAHEYAHVKYRHGVRAMARAFSGYLFLAVLAGDVGGASAVLLQNAGSLKTLQYTRALEKEADLEGMRMLQRSGIDPRGMPGLLGKLRELGADTPLELVSSHPLLDKRIAYLEQEIARDTIQAGPSLALEEAWRRLQSSQGR